MGIAIDACIGSYVDDFLATLLSAKFFVQAMRKYGLKPIDCFRIWFTWDEIKPIVIFSVKAGIPAVISSMLSLADLYLWLKYVPQFATIKTLAMIGGSIGDLMNRFGIPNLTPLVSESYMNDKPRLTQYYMGEMFRFNILIIGFFAPLILTVYKILPIAWNAMNMIYYSAASVFIIPRFIQLIITGYTSIAGQITTGSNKINFTMVIGISAKISGWCFTFFLIAVLQLSKRFGLVAAVFVINLTYPFVDVIFAPVSSLYIHKKIVKIRLPLK